MTDQKQMSASPTGSLRENKGKAPMSWFPYEAIEATTMVLYKSSTDGGGKYEKHNWRKGNYLSVPLDSALRHIFKRLRGEKTDPETGLPHLWHALCNLVFAVYYEMRFPWADDLPTETVPFDLDPLSVEPGRVIMPSSGVSVESLKGGG